MSRIFFHFFTWGAFGAPGYGYGAFQALVVAPEGRVYPGVPNGAPGYGYGADPRAVDCTSGG